jgi:methionyl-tRNA formyltransferase
MKIVFMGTPDFAVESLKLLINSRHEIMAVVTQPDKKRNRGKVTFSPVKELALKNNITVLQPIRIKEDDEFYARLKEFSPDLIVVVAFGQILPKKILDLPRMGCINVHGSLLPKLRGASPIHHAILNGEEITGISIMRMEEGLDSGPVYTMEATEVDEKQIEELHDELAKIGGKLLINTIDEIEYNNLEPKEQNHELSSYAPIINKSDGRIDFNDSAESIIRKIRAFNVWPGAYATLDDKKYRFYKAEINRINSDEDPGTIIKTDKDILIKCGRDAVSITEIQVEGKKRMSVNDFLKGNHIETGSRFI